MFRGTCVAVVSALLVCAAVAQRGGVLNVPTSEVSVRVVLDNDRAVRNLQLNVQLVNGTGALVGTAYTDIDGLAHFTGITAGPYAVRVMGSEIEEATQTFTVNRMENVHSEYVHVKLRAGPDVGSAEGMVSARTLNIPDKARKEFEKGNDAFQNNDLKAALQHYRKASAIYPEFAAAENNLAGICLRMQNYGCAREALQRALQVDPHFGRALLHMGRLKLMEKNLTEAESSFEQALQVEPMNPEMLMFMARTELLLHKVPEAVQYARRVHTVPHEHFAPAHLIAAEGLELQGKAREAAAEYELFLQEAPQNPAVRQVREALARVNAHADRSVPPR
jgi:tetratricopeptide (TPR) repeat protein